MIFQAIKISIEDIKERDGKFKISIKNLFGILKDAIDYILAKNLFLTFIYEEIEDGKLIGYCIMSGDTVYKLFVKKEYRGKGVGSKLVPKYARFAMSRKSAIGFYEKLGFELKEELKGIYIMTREV